MRNTQTPSSARFEAPFAKSHYAITERVECFDCSCCPPNVVRLFSSLGNYVYGAEGDVLFVNQFVASKLSSEGISCVQKTNYPHNGTRKRCFFDKYRNARAKREELFLRVCFFIVSAEINHHLGWQNEKL